MRGYTRDDVTLHSDGFGRGGQPAVNVKVGRPFSLHGEHAAHQVVERFGCSEATAQQALGWAFEMAQEDFWYGLAPAQAERYFGPCKVYSEGRSGGWLVLAPKLKDGMVTSRSLFPPVEQWDGPMINRWALFERAIRREVDYLTSWEWAEDMIDANEWAIDQTAIEGMIAVALA